MLGSFRLQLALAFGTLVLVMSAALSWALGWVGSHRATSDRSDALHTLAQSTAVMLADGLFERMREVTLLADAPAAGGPARWAATLARVQATRPHFSWMGLVAPDGRVEVATGKLLVGQDVSARPWFQAGRQGLYLGDLHQARLLADKLPRPGDGLPLRFIDFAAPVFDERGALRGVLGVHASWQWAGEVIATLRSPLAHDQGVTVFVLDEGGVPIHWPANVAEATVPGAAVPFKGARLIEWNDGQTYLTAGAPLPARPGVPDLGWTVVTRQPLDDALQSAHEARRTALAAGALCSLLAGALAWWLAAQLSRPLARIAHAARALEAGDLDTRIPPPAGPRELRLLSQALRSMVDALLLREHKLRLREQALEEINQTLEQRVEERTLALTEAQQALMKANAELRTLADHDTLTGLLNRRAGDRRLAQELARHRRGGQDLALVLLDIDHFKAVNDRHGHAAGDAVLRAVAAALREACRVSDTVARYGGEEFLVLLPETGAGGARAAAEKLRTAVQALQVPVGTPQPLAVTISLGVAVPAQAFDDGHAALKAADEALYASKRGGRNRVTLCAAAAVAADAPA